MNTCRPAYAHVLVEPTQKVNVTSEFFLKSQFINIHKCQMQTESQKKTSHISHILGFHKLYSIIMYSADQQISCVYLKQHLLVMEMLGVQQHLSQQ